MNLPTTNQQLPAFCHILILPIAIMATAMPCCCWWWWWWWWCQLSSNQTTRSIATTRWSQIRDRYNCLHCS